MFVMSTFYVLIIQYRKNTAKTDVLCRYITHTDQMTLYLFSWKNTFLIESETNYDNYSILCLSFKTSLPEKTINR